MSYFAEARFSAYILDQWASVRARLGEIQKAHVDAAVYLHAATTTKGHDAIRLIDALTDIQTATQRALETIQRINGASVAWSIGGDET